MAAAHRYTTIQISVVPPLIAGAIDPLIYFGMAWNRAEEASAYAAGLANSMGLLCFAVQQDRLRT